MLGGGFLILHQEPTEHRKIRNPGLEIEKLLVFLLFFGQTFYGVLQFETKLHKFAADSDDRCEKSVVAPASFGHQIIYLKPFPFLIVCLSWP